MKSSAKLLVMFALINAVFAAISIRRENKETVASIGTQLPLADEFIASRSLNALLSVLVAGVAVSQAWLCNQGNAKRRRARVDVHEA